MFVNSLILKVGLFCKSFCLKWYLSKFDTLRPLYKICDYRYEMRSEKEINFIITKVIISSTFSGDSWFAHHLGFRESPVAVKNYIAVEDFEDHSECLENNRPNLLQLKIACDYSHKIPIFLTKMIWIKKVILVILLKKIFFMNKWSNKIGRQII